MPKKTIRSDKKKTQAKVTKAVLNNPTATEREIAKIAWVSRSSAHRQKTELEQTGALSKDTRIRAIADSDLRITILGQSELIDRLQDEAKRSKIQARDLNAIIDSSVKRRAFIWWDNTDKDGLEKQNAVLTPEQTASISSLLDRLGF